MSRCPYCRRELPGFETLCQECFEAGYDRIVHPMPWWKRLRLRLTYESMYVFLFIFVYVYLLAAINRDSHPTMPELALLACMLAAFLVLIDIGMRDSGEPKSVRRSLYVFLILFVYFFLRFWSVSSYHPTKNPGLTAFGFAVIATLVGSVRKDPNQSAGPQKKGAGG